MKKIRSAKRIRVQDVSGTAILFIGLLVTGVALLESWRGWIYAPFPILHALLALIIPIWFNGLNSGNPWRELRSNIRRLIAPLTIAFIFIAGYMILYSLFLNATGRIADANWDLLATYKLLGRIYINRYDRSTVLILGYLLVGIWPMFGEELFYRGFVFKGLVVHHTSPTTAAILSSFLFGLRHSFQLVYLLPAYPFVSGAAYFVWATGLGLLWAWAYQRSQSLWCCIFTHSPNLILAPLVFVLLKP